MSIATEIKRISDSKEDIRTSIINKGVQVDVSVKIDDYPEYIDAIGTTNTVVPKHEDVDGIDENIERIELAKVKMKTSIRNKGVQIADSVLIHDIYAYIDLIPTGEDDPYVVEYATNSAVIDWLVRNNFTFENPSVGIKKSEAKAITELPAADSTLKSNLISFDELVYFTGLTALGKTNDSAASTTSPFVGCSKLTSITLPPTVTDLGRSCFDNCSSLSIVNGCKATTLWRSCFANCKRLDVSTVDTSNVTKIYGAYVIAYQCKSNTTDIIDLTNLREIGKSSSISNTNTAPIYFYGNNIRIKLPSINNVTFDIYNNGYAINGDSGSYILVPTGEIDLWKAKTYLNSKPMWIEY